MDCGLIAYCNCLIKIFLITLKWKRNKNESSLIRLTAINHIMAINVFNVRVVL